VLLIVRNVVMYAEEIDSFI